ncbi:hypothetical protein HDU76_008588, partial [Blyttiomyces sp. JEL0837]
YLMGCNVNLGDMRYCYQNLDYDNCYAVWLRVKQLSKDDDTFRDLVVLENIGLTLLGIATAFGYDDIVKILLKRHDLEKDNLGIDIACKSGKLNLVKLLMEMVPGINVSNGLYAAVDGPFPSKKNGVDIVHFRYWVNSGLVDPAADNSAVLSQVSSKFGGRVILRYLLGLEGMDPSAADNEALYVAVWEGIPATVKVLLDSSKLRETMPPNWEPVWHWDLLDHQKYLESDTLDNTRDIIGNCFSYFLLVAVRLSKYENVYVEIVRLLMDSGRCDPGVMQCKIFRDVANPKVAKLLLETGLALPFELYQMVVKQGQITEPPDVVHLIFVLYTALPAGCLDTIEYLLRKSLDMANNDMDLGKVRAIEIIENSAMRQKNEYITPSYISEAYNLSISFGFHLTLAEILPYTDAVAFTRGFLSACRDLKVHMVGVFFKFDMGRCEELVKEGLELVKGRTRFEDGEG